jgi:hypothetical protein
MKFYEIKNKKTGEHGRAIAKNLAEQRKSKGWRPHDSQCIWSAICEGAY